MSAAHVLITRLANPADALAPSQLAKLEQNDRRRADRFRHSAERARFVTGRLLLIYGLRTLYGLLSPALTIAAHGKPMLADTRLDIDISLAHRGEYVICGSALDALIGVDVEPIDRSWNVMEVASEQFTALECETLLALREPDRRRMFFRFWTLKEALVKATGSGLMISLDSFELALDPPRLCGVCPGIGDASQWRFAETHVGDACIAVAVRDGGIGTFTFHDVPISKL